jgi:hypothetical protein
MRMGSEVLQESGQGRCVYIDNFLYIIPHHTHMMTTNTYRNVYAPYLKSSDLMGTCSPLTNVSFSRNRRRRGRFLPRGEKGRTIHTKMSPFVVPASEKVLHYAIYDSDNHIFFDFIVLSYILLSLSLSLSYISIIFTYLRRGR